MPNRLTKPTRALPQTLNETLAEWFMGMETRMFMTKELIAIKIKRLRQEHDLPELAVTEGHVNAAVAEVRRILESKHSLTLYCIPKLGYKVSTPAEIAEYCAKWVKRTVLYADRTYRLVDAVKVQKAEHLLQNELRRAFSDTSGRIKAVSETGRQYLKVVAGLTKTRKGLTHDKTMQG